MAKIIENVLVVKVSKLVRDNSDQNLLPGEVQEQIEDVLQELLGSDVIVEVERA